MKLTPFGHAVRKLRLAYDLAMKTMADAMGISSSHLSGIEYGEKRLNQQHIAAVLAFFKEIATAEELAVLQGAAEKSKDIVVTKDLSADARGLVAAFARRLQDGDAPTAEILDWISGAKKEPRK